MAEISFYQLTSSSMESALPRLLEKAYASGKRVLVLAANDEKAEEYNRVLWTYHPHRFLPHGSAKDGNPEEQPIFITTDLARNPNGADILAVTGDKEADFGGFSRVLYIFDGNDKESLAKARGLWKENKANEAQLSYFKQDEKGKWDKVEIA